MYNFCKIVQDLLPNYMEKTTFEETNKFIEEHLEHCKECTKIYNDMKLNLEVPTENIDEGVDYMKKFNKEVKHLKFWKKVLIVITLIIGILAGIVLYRYSVLSKLYNLAEKNNKITNIHFVIETSEQNNHRIEEVWKKDNLKTEKIQDVESNQEIKFWADSNTNESYLVIDKEKTYAEAPDSISSLPGLFEYVTHPDGRLQAAINPTISIENIEYEGKECYRIKEKRDPKWTYDSEIIYEKSTGFILFESSAGSKLEGETNWSKKEIKYRYEVNTVTDKDVAKPDLTQYKNNSDK